MTNQNNIRNFSIIAHIDHGKSTPLRPAHRGLRRGVRPDMENQILDSMDLERERGITIKGPAITLRYRGTTGRSYVLNLIDTPGT